MFGRSSKPKFDRPKEEYIELIRDMLFGDTYIVTINDAPYDVFTTNGSQRKCKTKHFTMYYDMKDRHEPILRDEVADRLDRGYSIQEVACDLKSIDIPHIHFIKIVE